MKTKAEREKSLTNVGLNECSFLFDGKGDYLEEYALAERYVPTSSYTTTTPTDNMHTSYQGTVPQEGYLLIFVFIRVRQYFTRLELEDSRINARLPPGVQIPSFRSYVEEGVAGCLPKPAGRLKFTASQSRHWLEHGTQVMESILVRKVCRLGFAFAPEGLRTACLLTSWITLVCTRETQHTSRIRLG